MASNTAFLEKLCRSLVSACMQPVCSRLAESEAQPQAVVGKAASTYRLVSAAVGRHHDQQTRLTASLLEENAQLRQSLQARDRELQGLLAAQESRSRQESEKLSALLQHMVAFAEFFTSSQTTQREARVQINGIRAASTEACSAQASALTSNAEELLKSSQHLVADVAVMQEDAAKSAINFLAKPEASLHDLSRIQTMVEERVTADVARFSQIDKENVRCRAGKPKEVQQPQTKKHLAPRNT